MNILMLSVTIVRINVRGNDNKIVLVFMTFSMSTVIRKRYSEFELTQSICMHVLLASCFWDRIKPMRSSFWFNEFQAGVNSRALMSYPYHTIHFFRYQKPVPSHLKCKSLGFGNIFKAKISYPRVLNGEYMREFYKFSMILQTTKIHSFTHGTVCIPS